MSIYRRAFTLVEILIVVVILGILAAVVAAAFTQTTADAASEATYTELQKLRRHMEVYRARSGRLPDVTEGMGEAAWGPLVGPDHFLSAPVNAWVGGANARYVRVVPDAVPDVAFHTNYGWVFDPVRGNVFAGGFDANDRPLPRN